MATQDLVCLVVWDHMVLMEEGDLLDQWEEWGPMAGVDLEVVSVLHMGWVGSQELMAWVMALLMALHMASQTMALAPMASLKVMASNLPMASSPLPMVNNLQLLILLRVMGKHSLSNLLDISLLNSLLTHSNLHIPSSLPILSQLTLNSQPIPSHLRMVNNLPIPSSLSILKVLQLDLSRHGSASSSLLETSPLSESS